MTTVEHTPEPLGESTPKPNLLQDNPNAGIADYQEHGIPYEHTIAYFIVGKLVLDGALNPLNFNFDTSGGATVIPGIPFIINSVAAALLDGLKAYGWEGNVSEIIEAAQVGENAGWKPKHLRGNGGAE